MLDELHKKKRNKNLAMLALILGWCALIFAVTIVKMAHGEEADEHPANPFKQERITHEQAMDASTEKLKTNGAAYRAKSEDAYNKMEDRNAVHQIAMVSTTQAMDKAGAAHQAKDDATKQKMDVDGAAHLEKTNPNPQHWWTDWLTRHKI